MVSTVPCSGNRSLFTISAFAAVPQLNVLYLGAALTANRLPLFIVVNLNTGAITAQFDADENGPAALNYYVYFGRAADPLGVLWVPDVAAGVRVFASQGAATVKGQPPHTSLVSVAAAVHSGPAHP